MHSHASFNRIYRLVWSAVHQTWVVASELANGRGKSSSTPLLSAALLASLASLSGGAGAAPQGGQVVSGSGSISTSINASGTTTTITQASDKLSLNWQSFNVGKTESVNFLQPSPTALAVNRIFDTQGSQILGRINANGQVWLINPNGVLFGKDAQINVGGLLASTLNPDDATIGSARSNFSGSSTAGVVNLGSINAAQGGYVALLGHSVYNPGSISAPGGTVALGAGSAVSLNFAGSKLLGLEVTTNQVNALAENGGLIQADGGQVLLSAGARESLLASVVNNTGIIQARTVQEQDGKIILLGGMAAGTTNVAGTLDASAPSGGNGGFIETSAYKVKVDDSASITTASEQGLQGQWLLDPFDFYIAASTDSKSNITGAALGTALGSNNVTIQTVASADPTVTGATASGSYTSDLGDIFVNDAVSWSANYTLTLNAYNSIYLNSAVTATGASGKLALLYGQASTTGGSANYFVNAPVSLQAGANFSTKLGTSTSGANALRNYTVITRLGNEGDENREDATSSLQGLGHVTRLSGNYVLGADINASSTSNWNSTGFVYKGFSPIGDDNKQFTGAFDGLGHTITGLTINRTQAGYVGLFSYAGSGSVVKNIGLSGGSVIGGDFTSGGLVGTNLGTISNSYAMGSVSGNSYVGGLVGDNNGIVNNSYATGAVRGDSFVGGLVGNNSGSISSSYATGRVDGIIDTGGLVGGNGGTVSNSYATGRVNGDINVGGLVGVSDGTISNSYFDKGTTGQENGVGSDFSASGVTGLTTDNAFKQSSYSSLDFTNTWYMVDGATRPLLRSEWSTTVRNNHQLQLMAMPGKLGSSYTLANNLNLTADLTNSSSMWKTYGTTSSTFTSDYGFSPIGTFTGSFDGQGHTITGLSINRGTTDNVGLFGIVGTGGVVQNVGLVDANVIGREKVGGLAGSNEGAISNSYATGRIRGMDEFQVGGLAGYNKGTISSSYATGNISGSNTDNTSEGGHIGGLVGLNDGTITNSYAVGKVTGFFSVGGLVGYNNGKITNTYATGDVNGDAVDDLSRDVGGLIGYNSSNGSISSSYATGRVASASTTHVGGLVGQNDGGTLSSSYFDTGTTEQARGVGYGTTTGVTGLNSSAMKQSSKFIGWSISSVGGSSATWRIYNGSTAPLLRTFLTSLAIADASTTYSGAAQSGSSVSSDKIWGSAASGTNAGSYTNTFYSNQQGYDLSGGTLTINKASLTVTGESASTTYTGVAQTLTGYNVIGLLGGDNESSLSGVSASVTGINAGSYTNLVTAGTQTNYMVTTANGTLTIDKAPLTITGSSASKTYSGVAQTLTGYTTSGLLGSDNESSLSGVSASVSGTNAGSYTNSVTADTQTNYTVTTANGTLTIDKAPLTITGSSASKTYTGAAQTLTGYTASGLLGGDTISSLSGVSASGANGTNAGSYTNSVTAGTQTNYTVTTANGTLRIDKAPLTITGASASTTYTGVAQTLTGYTTSGLLGSDNESSLSGVSASVSGTNAGSYTNSVTAGTQTNYTVTTSNGTLTINKKALTVSGTSAVGKIYDGSTAAAFTVGKLSGFVNSETVSATASGTFDSQNAGSRRATASYTLVNGTGLVSNYSLADTTGHSATIAKAALTVSGTTAAGKTYDGNTTAAITMGTLSGFVNGETVSATASGTFESQNAGSRTATATYKLANGTNGGLATNYSLADTTGHSANIAKAALTYTADAASFRTGTKLTGLSGTLSGFVNQETQSTATTGTLAWVTPATIASGAGSYAIDGSRLLADNYSFSQAGGNATALTLLQTTSFVPVVSITPLPSNTSFVKTAEVALAGQQFRALTGLNSLPPTEAGSGQALGSGGISNVIQPLGQSGVLYVQGNGINLPNGYYQALPTNLE